MGLVVVSKSLSPVIKRSGTRFPGRQTCPLAADLAHAFVRLAGPLQGAPITIHFSWPSEWDDSHPTPFFPFPLRDKIIATAWVQAIDPCRMPGISVRNR